MLRVGIVAVPIVASFATAWTLSSLTAVPSTFAGAALRWLLIAAAATVVLVAVERLTRRLAPLATLLALSLTFPDRAPSRFRVALRNSSTRQLHDRIDEARRGVLGNTPAEAAERVLELVAALSVHDRTTRGHSERVRAYSRMLGEELGLGDVELDRLQWAGLLHDVGKLLIPDAILNKPGRLTAAEYEEVCKHPDYGRGMVAPLIPWLGESARAVWEHHERWDGGGYPAGLAGLDIALAARIVAVADTFDVMTSARSYKEPVSAAESRAELARCAGGQFDPVVVRAFLNISIGRLRLVMGPISWLAQVPLFPTSVLTGAVGGNAATIARDPRRCRRGHVRPARTSSTPRRVRRRSSRNGRRHRLRHRIARPARPSSQPTGRDRHARPWRRSATTVSALELASQFAESNSSIVAPAPTPSTSSPSSAPAVDRDADRRAGDVDRRAGRDVAVDAGRDVPSSPVVTVPSVAGRDRADAAGRDRADPTPVVDGPRRRPRSRGLRSSSWAPPPNFAVLAYAAVTSTGPTSITGHVGNTAAAITGLMPSQLHFGEIFDTSPTTAAAAQSAAAAAQVFLDGSDRFAAAWRRPRRTHDQPGRLSRAARSS